MPTVTINLTEDELNCGRARRMLMVEDAFSCLHDAEQTLRYILKNCDVDAHVDARLVDVTTDISLMLEAGGYV